jgi:hypothetical protein
MTMTRAEEYRQFMETKGRLYGRLLGVVREIESECTDRRANDGDDGSDPSRAVAQLLLARAIILSMLDDMQAKARELAVASASERAPGIVELWELLFDLWGLYHQPVRWES